MNPVLPRTLTLGLTGALVVAAGGGVASAATPTKPKASITISALTASVGKALSVDARKSKLPKGDKLKSGKVTWGDGSKATTLRSLTWKAQHAYAKAGTYTVTLSLVDKHGAKSSTTKKVSIKALPTTGVTTTTSTVINTTTTTVTQLLAGFPLQLPAGLQATTLVSQLRLTPTQLGGLSTLLATPAAVLPTLPVGFLKLLPAADLVLPTGASLPTLPGLAGVPLVGDLVTTLGLTGLPVAIPLPTTLTGTQSLGTVPSYILSSVQLSALSALFGVPVSTVSQLPLVSLFLLPSSLFHLGAGSSTASLPVSVPTLLPATDLISSLGLSADTLVAVANLIDVPANLVGTLPVGFLQLLPSADLSAPHGLPTLPGLTSLPLVGDVLSVLPGTILGLPISLPNGLGDTAQIGSLGTSLISLVQLGSLSTLMGVPTATVAKLPLAALHLLPGNLTQYGVTSTPTSGLPYTAPSTGLTSTTTVGSLGLSSDVLTAFAAKLGIPSSVLSALPVGILSTLPSSLLTLPAGGLPALPSLALGSLPVSLPTGLSPTTLVGDLPTSILSTVSATLLATVLGITTGQLDQLPVGLLPTSAVTFTGTILGTVQSVLPLTLPSGLLPTSTIGSLSLTSAQLDSVSALTGIASATLATLPVGFLKLLPAGSTTGTLPALPGLGSLPVVGNVLAMLLAGLPVHLPSGTAASAALGSLPGTVLDLLQLTTLSTVLGVPTSVLSVLPVSSLGLLPSGYVTGL